MFFLRTLHLLAVSGSVSLVPSFEFEFRGQTGFAQEVPHCRNELMKERVSRKKNLAWTISSRFNERMGTIPTTTFVINT